MIFKISLNLILPLFVKISFFSFLNLKPLEILFPFTIKSVLWWGLRILWRLLESSAAGTHCLKCTYKSENREHVVCCCVILPQMKFIRGMWQGNSWIENKYTFCLFSFYDCAVPVSICDGKRCEAVSVYARNRSQWRFKLNLSEIRKNTIYAAPASVTVKWKTQNRKKENK